MNKQNTIVEEWHDCHSKEIRNTADLTFLTLVLTSLGLFKNQIRRTVLMATTNMNQHKWVAAMWREFSMALKSPWLLSLSYFLFVQSSQVFTKGGEIEQNSYKVILNYKLLTKDKMLKYHHAIAGKGNKCYGWDSNFVMRIVSH